MQSSLKHIAIFASGTGSNAEKIIEYFKTHGKIKVSLIVSNNPNAKVIQLAKRESVAFYITNKEDFFYSYSILQILKAHQIDFIALAGFLWKIPVPLIQAYPNKIINLHPALLPKFGGKGMYGMNVHEAVLKAGENESGISIHYVNEELDKGDIIFQVKCKIEGNDTAETLSKKVKALEHVYYPEIIERCLAQQQ
jgi:phosphoribosylglycinamide formyltransferase-1